MSVTIRDVASLSHVSAATVSRVINHDPRISPETSARVTAAIQSLGYAVNHIARSLKTNRSFSVGLLCPEFANEFFMEIAKGIESSLKAKQYSLIICNSNESAAEEKDRIALLLRTCVDGIIIIPASDEGEHYQAIQNAGVPVVLVDRLVKNFVTDAVLVDNSNGTYRAIERVIQDGCHRIGFIGGDQRLTSARERLEGYHRALNDYQIQLDPDIECFGDFHIETGYQLMSQLLSLPEPPTAVFISNFSMHVGATKFINEHRNQLASIPAIVSFDDIELSFALGYCTTIVRQPTLQLGQTAAELLLNRIVDNDTSSAKLVRLRTEIVTR